MAKASTSKNVQVAKTQVKDSTQRTESKSTKPGFKKAKKGTFWDFPLTKKNMIYLAIGIVVIIIGFLMLMSGITEEPALLEGKWNNVFAVVIGPIFLVIGYCVLIPLALMKYFKTKSEDRQS